MKVHAVSEIRKRQNQFQKTTFTQQLAKNVALLSQTVAELRNNVLREVTENPALEIKNDPNYESIETIQREKYLGNDANKRFQLIESRLVSPTTLHDYLLKQLHLEIDDERERAIGAKIIENLDEYGFYSSAPQEICSDIPDVTKEAVDKITHIIQGCDPIGCATAGVMDSLDIQVEHLEISEPHKALLHECISLIADSAKDTTIGKQLSRYLAQDEIKHYFHQITPYPGLAYNPHFTSKSERYIIPDGVIVILDDGSVQVRINNDIIPIIDIKQDVQEIANGEDKTIADFANQCIQDAQLFMTGLKYRHYSLEKVVTFIAHTQLDFFTEKQEYLHPLTRKTIASALDFNESTISRIVTDKYIQTPRGIFEIKHFLSHSLGSANTSVDEIEKAIQKIISQFPEKRPSDEKIAEILALQGIKIARRTVAKYRKESEGLV